VAIVGLNKLVVAKTQTTTKWVDHIYPLGRCDTERSDLYLSRASSHAGNHSLAFNLAALNTSEYEFHLICSMNH
jgi:hypothetical protein